MLKTTIAVNLLSFPVPELIQEAVAPIQPPGPAAVLEARPVPRSFALSEIPADKLAAMCDAFREEVFKKAKISDPKELKTRADILGGSAAFSAADRACKLISFVVAERHIKGLTTVLNDAANIGLISDYNSEGDTITTVLTPSIRISFHK